MMAEYRGVSLRYAVLTAIILLLTVSSASSVDHLARQAATREVLATLRDSAKYDRAVMPLNRTGAVDSEVQIYFRDIDVDDINMQVTVDMTFRMVWRDPRLAFKTPGVTFVTLTNPELAWIPDAFFKSAISTKQQSTVFPQHFLRVHKGGKLIFSTRLIIVFSCPMDFSRFPHDKQQCHISIASYGYTEEHLKFKFANEKSVFYSAAGMQSVNFVLDRVTTSGCNSNTTTGIYSCVMATMILDRVVQSYIVEWYIPCIFLVIVAAMSELVVPSEFLARVLLVLVPLITLCIYSIMYSLYTTPSVSYSRAIDVFSGISLIIIFLQLIRVVVLHCFAQRKIREEKGELLPRQPRGECLEKVIANADFICKVFLAGFYGLFLLTYFLAYNV